MGWRLLHFCGAFGWASGAYTMLSAYGVHPASAIGVVACIVLSCVCLYAAVEDKP